MRRSIDVDSEEMTRVVRAAVEYGKMEQFANMVMAGWPDSTSGDSASNLAMELVNGKYVDLIGHLTQIGFNDMIDDIVHEALGDKEEEP